MSLVPGGLAPPNVGYTLQMPLSSDTPTDGFIACRHTSCGLRCVCGAFVEGRVTFALVSDVFLGVSDSVAGVRDTLGIVAEVRGIVTMVSDVLPEVRGTVVRVRGGVALASVGCGTLARGPRRPCDGVRNRVGATPRRCCRRSARPRRRVATESGLPRPRQVLRRCFPVLGTLAEVCGELALASERVGAAAVPLR